jgi:hypothetical protein
VDKPAPDALAADEPVLDESGSSCLKRTKEQKNRRGVLSMSMGMSDPEARKKLSDARWLQHKHESEKQSWPFWKRLIHRFQNCPLCRPEKVEQ